MTMAPQYPPENAIKPAPPPTPLKSKKYKQEKYEEFVNSVTYLFLYGIKSMTKDQIYNTIKKEWQKCLCI